MNINFLKHRKLLVIISLLIIVGGITYGLVTGYKFDVDFKGGTKIETNINEEFDNNEIQNIVSGITNEKPLVQKITGGNNAVSITSNPMNEETSGKVVEALKTKYTKMEEPSIRNVQASYGKELLNSALIAIIASVILILIYVAIRFKTLGFTAALTAVLSLVHDVLFLIAIYGIIKFPINTTFVAVALTIIGYSINDTIIVYDRIRENKKKITKSKDLLDTINVSIAQVLKRTLITSITTVTAIIIVYVFAILNNQQTLMEFSLPLIIGVVVGTYSSVFIASSLWYSFDKFFSKLKSKKEAKKKA
ncbi:MAG: protein translocase subunit SecF [Clostridia bacterium]|nr:protein translocase subunit SecF [Clostridia bacterium]